MSDTLGAPAPAESTPAPVADAPVSPPNPISTEPEGQPAPDAKPEGKPDKAEAKPEAKPLTARQALEKAALKVEKDNAETKPEVKTDPKAKPEAKAEAKPTETKPRGEHGHFAPKDAKPDATAEQKPTTEAKPSYTAGDPPARFTKDVKDVWATLPENVRGEVSRMERELTQGYEKHKQAAERDASINEFHEMAQKHGTTVKEALTMYTNIEGMLAKDFVGGLRHICERNGHSLRDIAAHVLNQKPEEIANDQSATIRDLNSKIERLEKQVGTVSKTFQHQQETTVGKEVTAFAADHPRFEELHEDIAFFLQTRCPGDLKKAYELAERLNPAPAKAVEAEAPKAPVIDLSAQTEKGSKSINGSPSPGSSPGKRQPSNSIKEALKRATAAAS